jgi:uncharacterized surface protein with fasciclin (FAS1) repeats
MESGQFSIFINAIQEAGLLDILRSEGQFTIFAPTNEAFAKFPKKTLDYLMKDKERLTEFLTYHVIFEKLKSKDILKLGHVKTVQGLELSFSNSGKVMVNKSRIIKKDIECKNGIMHIIDNVLIPM